MKKIKLICTIGPLTSNPKILKKFKNSGMDILRLNSSHGTIQWLKKTIKNIRKHLPDIPIILDLPGSKIRIQNKNLKKNINIGEEIIFTCDKKNIGSKIILNDKNIYKKVKINSLVFVDDGNLFFKITKKVGKNIHCKVLEKGIIKSGKGVNFEKIEVKNNNISNNEKKILAFARKVKPDFISISYTKNKSHVNRIKKLLKDENIKIIAKIENKSGIDNLKSILEVADAIMIDRGDLSLSSSINNVTLAQKEIINLANKFAKPVIVATELLKSMVSKSLPTKSEVSDITNAVHDGCAATMLSEETVIGKSPLLTIKTMNNIVNSASEYLELEKTNYKRKEKISNTICKAAIQICKNMPITKVIVITKTGYAARQLSIHNLKPLIYAVTNDKKTSRSFNLIKGTEGIFYNFKFLQKSTDHIIISIKNLYKQKKILINDLILVIAVGYPKKGNKMNLIQVHKVSDLINTFKW